MADKQNFTPDEWSKVLMSPTIAGMAITAADPSGLWGMLKESFASGSALVAVTNDPDANPLAKAVAADFETSEGREAIKHGLQERFSGASPKEIIPRALSTLAEVSGIIDAKAPQDAPGFKAWLVEISQKVADASTEGGFLGFGGVQVSDAEKATLDEIRSALSGTA